MASDDHNSHNHTEPSDGLTLKVKALESLLVEKGLVSEETLDALIETYEHKVGPRNGSLVVCTLCSCDPWPVLGLPPVWYKSALYRARAVRLLHSCFENWWVGLKTLLLENGLVSEDEFESSEPQFQASMHWG